MCKLLKLDLSSVSRPKLKSLLTKHFLASYNWIIFIRSLQVFVHTPSVCYHPLFPSPSPSLFILHISYCFFVTFCPSFSDNTLLQVEAAPLVQFTVWELPLFCGHHSLLLASVFWWVLFSFLYILVLLYLIPVFSLMFLPGVYFSYDIWHNLIVLLIPIFCKVYFIGS